MRAVSPCVCVGLLLISSCNPYAEVKKARAEAELARAEAEMARQRAEEEAARARAEAEAYKAQVGKTRAEAEGKKEAPDKAWPPKPSEADVRASFQALLAGAGVKAEIVKFHRTDWSLINEQQYYGVAYESELVFAAECQIKETMALMWSNGNIAVGSGGAMRGREVGTFKKGERKKVRGHIGYRLEKDRWKLDPGAQIDVGK